MEPYQTSENVLPTQGITRIHRASSPHKHLHNQTNKRHNSISPTHYTIQQPPNTTHPIPQPPPSKPSPTKKQNHQSKRSTRNTNRPTTTNNTPKKGPTNRQLNPENNANTQTNTAVTRRHHKPIQLSAQHTTSQHNKHQIIPRHQHNTVTTNQQHRLYHGLTPTQLQQHRKPTILTLQGTSSNTIHPSNHPQHRPKRPPRPTSPYHKGLHKPHIRLPSPQQSTPKPSRTNDRHHTNYQTIIHTHHNPYTKSNTNHPSTNHRRTNRNTNLPHSNLNQNQNTPYHTTTTTQSRNQTTYRLNRNPRIPQKKRRQPPSQAPFKPSLSTQTSQLPTNHQKGQSHSTQNTNHNPTTILSRNRRHSKQTGPRRTTNSRLYPRLLPKRRRQHLKHQKPTQAQPTTPHNTTPTSNEPGNHLHSKNTKFLRPTRRLTNTLLRDKVLNLIPQHPTKTNTSKANHPPKQRSILRPPHNTKPYQ